MVEHRPSRTWLDRLAIVLVIGLLAVGGLASYAVTQANTLAGYYADTRDTVVELCDDKANADKPECAVTPPPPEDVTELPPADVPKPVGPSAQQVRDATAALLPMFVGPGIADFCKGDRCKGKDAPRAKDGKNGTNGTNGRGIAGAQCIADGLILTYTDGTVENAGQCRGADGTNGTNGTDGEDWACPEGTSLQETTVMTSPTESTVIYACR